MGHQDKEALGSDHYYHLMRTVINKRPQTVTTTAQATRTVITYGRSNCCSSIRTARKKELPVISLAPKADTDYRTWTDINLCQQSRVTSLSK